MSQEPHKIIKGLSDRLDWVAMNLDPDPTYCRFVADHIDIFTELEKAVGSGAFYQGERRKLPQERQRQKTLKEDKASPALLSWVYTLFPDLTSHQFESETLEEFFEIGKPIQDSRERWRPAIRYFAENRTQLAKIAKKIYTECDDGAELGIDDIDFPLVVKQGWVRTEPLELTEFSEEKNLGFPAPGRDFPARTLEGLRGEYVAYKGALAYATRKVVKPEPQHNGEIFGVQNVLQDDKGFTGFSYFLSRYFTYINTCEVLGAELADWVVRFGETATPPELPFRGAPEAAFDLTNRATYPGVNCLTVFKNYSNRSEGIGRGNWFLLHKRDETQLQAQNTVHVVPAGGHQGYARGAHPEDTAIWRTMMREFAEELFDMEDLNKQPETWGDFLQPSKVAKIKEVFFGRVSPAAKVYMHGFGLDPITLKPEILITIIIDWDIAKRRWNDVRLKFNWELQKQGNSTETRHQWERLSKENLIYQARGGVQSIGDSSNSFMGTLPAGAACMIQTARHYDFLGLS